MGIDGISIIICCHNSASRLKETLNCLTIQRFSKPITWEVILVDNNSTDETAVRGAVIWKEGGQHAPMKIVVEPQQGLSYARMKGWQSSAYELLAFVDDDNSLFEDWVEKSYDFMVQHPQAGICGGQCLEYYEAVPENWFDQFKGMLAIGEQGQGTEDVTEKRQFVWGAGMVMRKSAIVKACSLGFNFITTGRKGNLLLASDDLELSLAVKALGYKIFYYDQLKLYHRIPASRLNWAYLKKVMRGFGYSSVWIDLYEWGMNGKYLHMSPRLLYLRHYMTLVKMVVRYNVLLLLPFIFPKGSRFSMRIEYALGRIQMLLGCGYGTYVNHAMSIRNYFLNIKREESGKH